MFRDFNFIKELLNMNMHKFLNYFMEDIGFGIKCIDFIGFTFIQFWDGLVIDEKIFFISCICVLVYYFFLDKNKY